MSYLYLLFVPISLAIAQYIAFKLQIKSKERVENIASFAAGFSVGYVFMILIPEIERMTNSRHLYAMTLALAGFTFFHAALKYAFKNHDQNKKSILVEEIHLFTAGLYAFLVSFSLVELMKEQFYQALVTWLVIVIHLSLNEINHSHMHHSKIANYKTPIVIISLLIGGVLPLFDLINSSIQVSLFALTAGAIIYISIREELPQESKGSPNLFILGASMMILLSIFYFYFG